MNATRKDRKVLMHVDRIVSGCINMTTQEFGQYHFLLYAQHQKGHINPDDVKAICKGETPSKKVMINFRKDRNGWLYNVVMQEECDRRREACGEQSKKALTRWKQKRDDAMPRHMHAAIDTRKSSSSSEYNNKNQKEEKMQERKPEIERPLFDAGISAEQIAEIRNLMPDITKAYIAEKIEMSNAPGVDNPAAYLYMALVHNYAPKSKIQLRDNRGQGSKEMKKAETIGWLSEADYSKLLPDDAARFFSDKDSSGRVSWYLKKEKLDTDAK